MTAPVKLNLGCGPTGIDGWLNYDWGVLPLLSKLPWLRRGLVQLGVLPASYDVPWSAIQLVDIRKRFPLADATVQFIYCSQVLEHLERWEALHVLQECHRVLVPGGCARVSVPDLAVICRTYLGATGGRPAQDACRLLWGHPKDEPPAGAVGRFSRRFIRGHQWCYDHAEMARLLRDAGFHDIRPCQFRAGATPDLDRVELDIHAPHSLYVEACK